MDLRFLANDKKIGPNLVAHIPKDGFKDIMAPIVINHDHNSVTFFFDEKNSLTADNNIEMLTEFLSTAVVRREVKGLRSEEAQELDELVLRMREIMRIARKRETRPSHNTNYKIASV